MIALACLAVILCAGVWLAGQNEQRRAARKEREAAEMVAQFEREAWISAEQRKSQARVDACAADLRSHDKKNDTFAFVQQAIATGKPRTGETMMAEVAKCRDLIVKSIASPQSD